MATYVNNLRLKEIAPGAESGTWGTSTNTNLELIADALGSGTEAITTNADAHTTTIADGAADEGRALFLKYTGTLDSACTITLAPETINKVWFIENATSGSQNIIISQGSGANITIANGKIAVILTDGAGGGAAVLDAFADLELSSTLTVAGAASLASTLAVTGAITGSSTIQGTTITATTAFVPDASDGAALGTTALEFSDLYLADGAVIGLGDDQDVTLTHVADTGLLLNSTRQLQFNDSSQYISGTSATVLSIAATDEIDLTATAVDLNGTLDVSGTLAVGGDTTLTGDLVVSSTGPHAIGATVQNAMMYVAGTKTSTGASSTVHGWWFNNLTAGASGDTTLQTALYCQGKVTTQAVSETITDVVNVLIAEPNITKGSGSSITNASSLKIEGAPSEGTNNYALWVDAGATRLDGDLDMSSGGDFYLKNGEKLYLDSGGDTYLWHSSSNNVVLHVGGQDCYTQTATATTFAKATTFSSTLSVTGAVTVGSSSEGSIRLSNVNTGSSRLEFANTSDTVRWCAGYRDDSGDGDYKIVHGTNLDAGNDLVVTATGVSISGTLAVTGVSTLTGNIDMPDNAKILLGTGDDLEIYHDGSNSIISETGTGGIKIFTAGVDTSGFYKIGGEELATFAPDGPVTLYYNDAVKIATASAGINVTGGIAQANGAADADILNTMTNSATSHLFGISDSSANRFVGSANNYAFWGTSTAHGLEFATNNNVRMTIASGGTVDVVGTFTAGTKTFKIDHPLPDKADSHHLIHSCIEGPRADLIYRGTVGLSGGSAQVDLDEAAGMSAGTWELLCRDPQVWLQNDSGWSGVRGSVEGNTLTIESKDTVSDDTVSWMVVAERQDETIREQSSTDDEGRLIVEPEKGDV